MSSQQLWLDATLETLRGYRNLIDGAVQQLDDRQLFQKPAPTFNSPANLLRHLGGNLRSRWFDFLNSDGEKPDRDRDLEFADWEGDRASLLDYFDEGWRTLVSAIESLSETDLASTVRIRGEAHTVPQAIQRSLTHTSYHVGQLVLVARLNRAAESWDWMTIAPGQSQQHNEKTWGTAASRSRFNAPDKASDSDGD